MARMMRCEYCGILQDEPQGAKICAQYSTNGTFLNDAPALPGQPVRIRTGDVLHCGQVSLIFYEE